MRLPDREPCPTALEVEPSANSTFKERACADADDMLRAQIQSISLRDTSALAFLYESCSPKVHRVAMRVVRDSHLADEVVADCFWQIWRDADRFDASRGSAMSWICSIARSRAIDALRRRQTYAKHEAPLEEVREDSESWLRSPPELVAERQRNSMLKRLLSRIPPLPRQLLFLSFVSGFSHQEIADHCGLSLGTVKSHIRRGLTSLRADCHGVGLNR